MDKTSIVNTFVGDSFENRGGGLRARKNRGGGRPETVGSPRGENVVKEMSRYKYETKD